MCVHGKIMQGHTKRVLRQSFLEATPCCSTPPFAFGHNLRVHDENMQGHTQGAFEAKPFGSYALVLYGILRIWLQYALA